MSISVSSTSGDPGAAARGAYVHIPFCAERCDYCAFALWTDRLDVAERYVDAVIAEIGMARAAGTFDVPSTVYLGGGTPSLLPGPLLVRLLDALGAPPGTEVTVEANPESTTPELLDALTGAGVTRISLGVESFDPAALVTLGRPSRHGAVAAAVRAIGASGIAEYGVDLLYGAVGESDASWQATVEAALGLDPAPQHVSVYALTVEPGTPLAQDPARHPDDDTLARRYLVADALLTAAGFGWYEISNFARPGHESRHNQAYWSGASYLGFGAAAHSHVDGHRFRNVWHIDRYLDRLESGRSPYAAGERLTEESRAYEALVLGLRTNAGVPVDALDLEGIAHLVTVEGGRAVLTPAGRMVADAIALRLQVAESPPEPVRVARPADLTGE